VQIDCHTCVGFQTDLCRDCVVTFILNSGESLDLDDEEVEALSLLADGGLVPRLRLSLNPRLEQSHGELPPFDRDRRGA
jgi:hypothetical protein